MNFPEQTFLFSVGQLGLWWVAPSHTGGRGAACPARRAGSSCSVPTAPSSRGHARWLYRAGLHCRHGRCSSMLCHFAAASVDRNPFPSSGSVRAPQGTACRAMPPGITHQAQPQQPNALQPVLDQRGLAACSSAGTYAAVQELVQQLQDRAQLLQNLKPASSRLEGT